MQTVGDIEYVGEAPHSGIGSLGYVDATPCAVDPRPIGFIWPEPSKDEPPRNEDR
jgi:hypothetical protein